MMSRRWVTGLLLGALAFAALPALPACSTAEASPIVGGAARYRTTPAAGGGYTAQDLVDDLKAAGTETALYVIEPAYITTSGSTITQISDQSGNGYHLTPSGTGPTFGATSGVNSQGGATFAGSNTIRDTTWANLDGDRVAVVFVGAWTDDDVWWAAIQFGSPNLSLYENGSDRWQTAVGFSGGYQDVNSDFVNDGAGHCHGFWMFAGSNDVEYDGVAYTNDFTGNDALGDLPTDNFELGPAGGDGVASMLVVYDAPDTGTRTAVDTAVQAFYGVPCD